MIVFRVSRFLRYLLLSGHRRGHGIHSPFVFNLITKVFRNKINPGIVSNIEKVRKELISDKGSILVKDLGSGSDSLKSDLRAVSDIAKYSPVSMKYGVLLTNMAAEFGKPHIIELGTSFGISTMYMAAASSESIVYTMEGCPATAEIATRNFKTTGIQNIRLFIGSFDETLPGLLNLDKKPGMVFIDGNHRKEALLDYFKQILEHSDNKTVILIDDINYSREMQEAWSEIKRYKEVSFTVDIFRMGIVFLRDGINHFNYMIRY